MRELNHGYRIDMATDTLHRLSCNSPGGLLCPMLEGLYWNIPSAGTALPFFRLFLSPHLKRVSFYTDSYSPGITPDIPWGQLAALVQIISFLPTFLEHLSIMCGAGKGGPLKDVISSFVCRCGSSLRSFETCVPLSEAGIRHLMQLPDLHTWYTVQEPPRTIPASIFPFLEQLHLGDHAAIPWLHLLASRGKGILRDGSASATSHSNTRETLKSLDCPRGTIVNSIFLSSVVNFSNLVRLRVHNFCRDGDGCSFRMTDDNVNNLTSALPRLEALELGNPCGLNSCENTVASLLSISVHCRDLTVLSIHFNTLTIVEDTQRLLDEGSGRDKARCKLEDLWVGSMPLEIRSEDIETVATGLKTIFPSLTRAGYDGRWRELRAKFFVGGSPETRLRSELGEICFGLPPLPGCTPLCNLKQSI